MPLASYLAQILSLAFRFFISRLGVALCLAISSLVVWFAPPALAGVSNIPGSGELRGVSMGTFSGDSTVDKASSAAFKVLSTAKVILNGLAIAFIVYLGLMMVIAYGDDGQLTKLKQQMIYILTAFLFINIPGQIYNIATAGRNTGARDVTGVPTGGDFGVSRTTGSNLFINFDLWNSTIENGVVAFLRILVIGFAVFYFTLAGFKLLVSGGNEETLKTAKRQAIYGFLALVFLGVIQGWVSVAYSGNIPQGQSLFASLANLALFFAGPVAIFFLTL
jgi:hypothetical protein